MNIPPIGSDEFFEWFDHLPKPPGWDTVQWDDDCHCAPLGSKHIVGCIYGPKEDGSERKLAERQVGEKS